MAQKNDKQKLLLTEVMNADAKDGLYDHSVDPNKMVSSVEWLAEKYNYVTWLRNRDEISPEVADNLRERYLNQAKQMEKKQIVKAYHQGTLDGHELKYGDGNQYYNEIYGKE